MYNEDRFIDLLKVFDEAFDQAILANRAAKRNCGCDTVDCDCECKSSKVEPKLFGNSLPCDIKQVIFNDPATIVTFSDGSKVCVKSCKGDKYSKELGLIYAIVKRLYADDVDESGYFKTTGFGEQIRKIIAEGIDQKVIEAEAQAKREAKREAKQKAKTAEAKKTETKKGKGVEAMNTVGEWVQKEVGKKPAKKTTNKKVTDTK